MSEKREEKNFEEVEKTLEEIRDEKGAARRRKNFGSAFSLRVFSFYACMARH